MNNGYFWQQESHCYLSRPQLFTMSLLHTLIEDIFLLLNLRWLTFMQIYCIPGAV